MRLFIIFLLLGLIQTGLTAQFLDDFSDGNLQNPNWSGDIANFIVNNEKVLQLNAPSAGNSSLTLAATALDSATWEMWIKMDFSPSQSNRLQIFLLAQNGQLSTTDGLYLTLGENGNDDAIHIIQRTSGIATTLASSTPSSIATSPVVLKIVIEKLKNDWTLFVDYSGGNNPVKITDWSTTNTPTGDIYFGFNCFYTATRVDKFEFDNISFEKWEADTTPPELSFAQANTNLELKVQFNEDINPAALIPQNFSISNGIGSPTGIQILSNSSANITLSEALTNGQAYTLTAHNIQDLSGNEGSSMIGFIFAEAETISPFDIIINEFLPDPNPSVGLPEKEFVELYNRSDKVINLKEITFAANSSEELLPDFNMPPKTYAILVNQEDIALWSSFENVIGIDLPGLTNSGATLSLYTTELIHEITYTSNSYKDSNKDDGGWSLALINPENNCLGESNWKASTNLQGGSPSKKNSVYDTNYQTENLTVLQVFSQSPTSVLLSFDQLVGENGSVLTNYSIHPTIEISSVQVQDDKVTLNFTSPMQVGVIYELTLFEGITNCIGEADTKKAYFKLGIAEPPAAGDILINELLFNPVSGGKDYIELYNGSTKIVDLSEFTLANLSKDDDIEPITAFGFLFPGMHVALTENPFQVLEQYNPPDTAWILENNLPSFNDEQGNVTLIHNGLVIDSMNYDEDMHLALVSNEDGVALERINPFGNSNERSNWISGASVSNYGTPGYRNQQFALTTRAGSEYIQTERKIFSPDGDGFQDFLLFQYSLPTSGYVLNARIFNAEGQYVYRLTNNEILGTFGQIRWDGVDDNNNAMPGGIYVIRFEFFKADGEKVIILKSCGLVR